MEGGEINTSSFLGRTMHTVVTREVHSHRMTVLIARGTDTGCGMEVGGAFGRSCNEWVTVNGNTFLSTNGGIQY